VQTLADLLDQFEAWRDRLPSGLANSATAEALYAVLELRGHVKDLQAVELPKLWTGLTAARHNAPLDQASSWGSAVCPRPKPSIRKGWHLDVPSAVIAKRAARESARLPGLSRLGRVAA
jgi:hypothetical protein